MSVASLILFLTAVAQGSYYFRNQIAAHLPQTKFYLLQACHYLQCKIELPTQIDMIVIDSNELLPMVDEGNMFSLSVLLQNKSSIVQAWPNLELSLNDEKDKLILKKVFLPAQYLSNPADLPKGFTANTDHSIKLYFELSDNQAAGYNVAVFYP